MEEPAANNAEKPAEEDPVDSAEGALPKKVEDSAEVVDKVEDSAETAKESFATGQSWKLGLALAAAAVLILAIGFVMTRP